MTRTMSNSNTAIMVTVEDFIKELNLAAERLEKFLEELGKWSSGRASMTSVYSKKLLKDIFSLSNW